ncbi:MAG: hypothetical protein H6935_08735 [Thiobacillus sp.]|nr:hypothetical protein [Thiobacillus sp.]
MAEQERQHFLKAQLVFWLLAAPDGHTKNFSLFIEQGGRFRQPPNSQVNEGPPRVYLTRSGGGLGAGRPWGRSALAAR